MVILSTVLCLLMLTHFVQKNDTEIVYNIQGTRISEQEK